MKKIRDLVNINIKDELWTLQSLPINNFDEYNLVGGKKLKDIGKFFFYGNNQFKHL